MNDHKRTYGVVLRAGIFSSLVIVTLLFIIVPYAEVEPYQLRREVVTMIEEIAAEIEKHPEPPPLDRPKPVVAVVGSDREETVETIPANELIESLIPTKPIGPDIEIVPFYKLEVKPQLVNSPALDYPELARRAGIEGSVVVKMLVDVDGSVSETIVLKSSGNSLLDNAALVTARACRFTPARQRDRTVRVWISRKFDFRLKES